MICSLRFGQICLSKQVELGNEETHIVRLDRFTWKNGEGFGGAATATVGFQGIRQKLFTIGTSAERKKCCVKRQLLAAEQRD